jgi:hypothetical protein
MPAEREVLKLVLDAIPHQEKDQMPDVADYRVISDDSITLQTGGDIDHSFNFDLGTAVQHGQSAVLQFFYITSSNANNLTFRFSINGTLVRTYIANGKLFGTIHEVQAGVTRDNGNTLDVRIVGGSGSVVISDVVLFVQREV